jgi:hypothetical protein
MSEGNWTPTKRSGPARPDGVEVRVIGGGMGDPRRRELEQGEWTEGELEAPHGDEEDVVKLDGGPVALANRRLEDEEKFEVDPLAEKKRGWSLRQVTLLMAGIAVLLAVLAVWAVIVFRKDSSEPDSIYGSLQVVDETPAEKVEVEEEIISLEEAQKYVEKAIKKFELYCEADSVDEIVPLVRNGEGLRPLLEERWSPFKSGDKMEGSMVSFDGKRLVLLSGMTADGDRFEMIFIFDDEELLIDWEASFAIGDVPLDELGSIEVGRMVRMRVGVSASNFHPLEYPDDKFRCFRLLVGYGSEDLFGYAEIGSDVVAELSEALNEGTLLLDRIGQTSAIVELRNDGRGNLGQFSITKFHQIGWIEP